MKGLLRNLLRMPPYGPCQPEKAELFLARMGPLTASHYQRQGPDFFAVGDGYDLRGDFVRRVVVKF